MQQKEYNYFSGMQGLTGNPFHCKAACHGVGYIFAAYSTLQCSVEK